MAQVFKTFDIDLPIETLSYTPAIDRERPTVIEMVITLHPNSTTYFKLDYDCAFIKAEEHYPDASYGFDIGVGMMRIDEKIVFTETALVRLPTPDFSMPYNVITLTCTALSLYYGSVFNMLTRQYFPIVQKQK
jgi:phosphatidylinositol glycan class T